ncbi:MAG: hypothetical protein N3E51_03665 [Candidatus Micrarchaeota archaeon]|nr:hypothetical protein [Candidatus Micrarchaeota archaeon]
MKKRRRGKKGAGKKEVRAGSLIPPSEKRSSPVRRVETGIAGFDSMVEGGLPEGTLNLLAGKVGTGRNIFALQYLIHGAKKGEPGVYITLEKEPEDVIALAESFGWKAKELVSEKRLSVIKPDMHRFETLKQSIIDEIERLGAKRLVIKPFSLISAYFNNVYDARKSLYELRREMQRLGCTALAVADVAEDSEAFSSSGYEEFVPNGVILLELITRKDSSSFVRTVFVRKMERTRHLLKRAPFEIGEDGIEVYPDAEVFE